MKAFITGGTGFIGRHVVRKLLDRGYEVAGLAHSKNSAAELRAGGVQVVSGDIHSVEAMREGMVGSDVVFHVAGWYKVGARDQTDAEAINVAGTRNVLRLAFELGIPRIIHTSTVAVFGDTKGQLVDESFVQGGPFVNEYDRTKWLAHYKVAVPLIKQGAPVIIVQPGVIYGPEDHSLIGQLMRLFYEGKMPAVPGYDFIVTYAHVEDIAEGLILAAEQGRPGESYVLAGPAIPLGEMVDFWGQLTGRRPPMLRIPARFLVPFGPVLGALGEIVPLPEILTQDTATMLGVTYMASADKARYELGWQQRTLQDGMSETFRWIAETTPPKQVPTDTEKKIAGLALLAAAVLLLLWFFGRRRD